MDFTNPLPFRHQREPNLPKPLQIPSAVPTLNPIPGDAEASGVDMQEQLHPRSNSLPSASPRPRSPLPPHKLAKIANALGVSTPMPAFYRSPSPSGSSSFRTPSRYLLHVVPPPFLPSDDDDDGSDPEGTNTVSASGYRNQFRRGTLIPLYPSLQSQLGAIAREFNLPSTGGLVLYLMHSSQGSATDGPRISDDVWKLLWHKALQAERTDSQVRTAASLDFRSGHSTPSSPFSNPNRENPHPQSSSSVRSPPSPFPYPSPSTSSTPSSDVHLPLSSQHQTSSPDLLADLTPNPFLPILAKVEFDIDRRKAGWFDAWAHGKRERSRWRAGSDGGRIQLALTKRAQSRDRFRTDFSSHSEDSSEYAILDDGEGEKTAVDDDDQDQDQATVVLRPQDPLADVFGNDAATWRELQAGRHAKLKTPTGLGISGPNPELIIPPVDEQHDEIADEPRDSEEVVKLWDQNRRPTLPLDPPDLRRKGAPAPLVLASSPDSLSSLSSRPQTGNSYLPYLTTVNPLESDTGSSSSELNMHDKKTRRRTGMVFGDLEVKVVAEPEEMSEAEIAAHRSSQVMMKHKLDQLEKLAVLSPRRYDGLPPPVPQSDLDSESDRPLRSAPPGATQFNVTPPRHKGTESIGSLRSNAAKDPFQIPPRKDSLAAPRLHSPRKEHKRGQSSQSSSGSSSKMLPEPPAGGAVWPAVGYASLSKSQPSLPTSPTTARPNNARLQDRSPPQLTLKRASDGRKVAPANVSEETQARALEADDGQDVLLPPAPISANPNSPVIPLSPDPFGKRPMEDMRQARPSEESNRPAPSGSRPPSRLQGTVLPAAVPEDSEMDTQSSRFSVDSDQGVEQLARQRRSRTNSIMSVRSLRNLWRKSGAPSKVSTTASGGGPLPPLPSTGDLSPLSPALPQSRPPSQHSRAESSSSQRSTRPAERSRRPSAAPRPDSGSDPFQFDNVNIYKSASSSSLASSATPTTPNFAAAGGSIGKSKGILKGWNGNANPSDAEVRRMRRPSLATLRRSMSSASQAELGERLRETRSPPPPSTPPDPRRGSTRHKQAPSIDPESVMMSHSLPTSSALGGLSRYPESLPSTSSSLSIDDGSTPRLAEFEIVSPPRRQAGLTPSVSSNGDISY